MRAVIYARYSTDLQRSASIDDQVRLCRERIEHEHGAVVAVYADYAISGGSLRNRPRMQALLAEAKSGRFDCVIAEALDRMSRDQEDVAAIYKRLRHADVKLFTLAEGEISELHVGLKGTMNALFLKDLASKIRRGQRGRIANGFSAGGLSYGYSVARELDESGEWTRGKRAIKQDEANMVRRIFTEYAAGKSPRRIAADLNLDRIPSPRGGQWNASTINGHRGRRNGILQNELYRGQVVYNRVRMVKDPETGKRISRLNPEKEWVRVEIPELRIVSDEAWEKVQQTRRRYRDQPTQNCRRPKRLLSGLLRCGKCGGAFTIVRPGKYGCATHREKGTCTNASQISANQLEHRVLAGIKQRLLQPTLLAAFVDEFNSELRRLKATSTRLGSESKKQLDELVKKIDRLVNAIAEGTDTPSLRRALLSLEHDKAELEKALAKYHGPAPVKPVRLPDLPALFRRRVENLEASLSANPTVTTQAANIFRTLIDGIVLHPRKKREAMPIEVHGEPRALFLFANDENVEERNWMITVVAEEGLEPQTRGL